MHEPQVRHWRGFHIEKMLWDDFRQSEPMACTYREKSCVDLAMCRLDNVIQTYSSLRMRAALLLR